LVDPKKNLRGPPFQEDNGRSIVVVSTVPHLRVRGRVETPPPELGSIYRKDVTPPSLNPTGIKGSFKCLRLKLKMLVRRARLQQTRNRVRMWSTRILVRLRPSLGPLNPILEKFQLLRRTPAVSRQLRLLLQRALPNLL
jgi:hypothetical protein